MSVNSIGSSTLSSFALGGLAEATSRITQSTQRLATNNRITSAGDDVASMSIAMQMRSQLTGMRQGLQNAIQADSALEVAFGGLNEITDILGSMKALTTQSNSGTLSPAERLFLDQDFQQLSQEIDRIASNTAFNRIQLLDGSVNEENDIDGNTTNATQATADLNFAVNIGAGQKVIINNVTFQEGVNFTAGASIALSLDSLVLALGSSTNLAISQASYQRVGNSVHVTHDAGGALGNQFVINQNTSTAAFTTVGGLTPTANLFTTQGGSNNGLYYGGVRVSGTIGDALVNTQSQTSATQTLNVTGVINNGEQLRIDNGAGGLVNFTFAAAAVATTDIQIGATTADTLQNAVAVINRYAASNDYGSRQIEAIRDGNDLTLTYRATGNATDTAGVVLDLAETLANGSLTGATLNNGTNTGVNVVGVTNPGFVGTVSGFSATFLGADNVTAQVDVGGITYTSNITDTTPAVTGFARFNSTTGGYFDVQLTTPGQAVADQTGADLYAARLEAAFSSLNFYQSRPVTSYVAAGQLAGSSVELSHDDFTDPTLEDISVTPPPGVGLDGTIDITINGEVFRSPANLGGTIGDFESIYLRSLNDSNRFIKFTAGSTTIDLSNQTNADTLEADLKTAFGFGTGGGSISIQVGNASNDTIQVRIPSVKTASLFSGATLDVITQASAAAAGTVIDDAIDQITSVTADIGAYQERIGFASNNLNQSITNIDTARGALEDTDIASESVNFAMAQLQANSAIAVLAQINALSSNLLQLVRPNN